MTTLLTELLQFVGPLAPVLLAAFAAWMKGYLRLGKLGETEIHAWIDAEEEKLSRPSGLKGIAERFAKLAKSQPPAP